MLWTVRLPLYRKVIISILLSSGLFAISAAIIRCVLSLINVNNIASATIWAIREAFITILAVSIPVIKPLFNRTKWISSINGNSGSASASRSRNRFSRIGSRSNAKDNNLIGRTRGGAVLDPEIGEWKGDDEATKRSEIELAQISRSESEEYIIEGPLQEDPIRMQQEALKINVTTEYTLAGSRTVDRETVSVQSRERPIQEAWGPLNGESTTAVTGGGHHKPKGSGGKMSRFFVTDK